MNLTRKIKRQAEREARDRARLAFKNETINLDPELFGKKEFLMGRTRGKKISEALLELIQPYLA